VRIQLSLTRAGRRGSAGRDEMKVSCPTASASPSHRHFQAGQEESYHFAPKSQGILDFFSEIFGCPVGAVAKVELNCDNRQSCLGPSNLATEWSPPIGVASARALVAIGDSRSGIVSKAGGLELWYGPEARVQPVVSGHGDKPPNTAGPGRSVSITVGWRHDGEFEIINVLPRVPALDTQRSEIEWWPEKKSRRGGKPAGDRLSPMLDSC
jgi:hypothetical protein